MQVCAERSKSIEQLAEAIHFFKVTLQWNDFLCIVSLELFDIGRLDTQSHNTKFME